MADKKEIIATHLLLYTDGGCRPGGRGIGGWAVHGYSYVEEKPKTGTGLKDVVPTAIGYLPKVGKGVGDAGKAPDGKKYDLVTVVEYFDSRGSIIPVTTNNRTELMAAFRALEIAESLGVQHMTCRIDSRYVCDGLTKWLDGWVRNNWVSSKGEEVANRDLWEKLLAIKDRLEAKGVSLNWMWVKAHNGDMGNERVDEMATSCIIAGRKGLDIDHLERSPAKGYWTPSIDVNRMLSQNKWYFNTNYAPTPQTEDGRYIYHLGEHGKEDDFLGKPMPDASFSVVFLKEQEPVLEHIRDHQNSLDPELFNSLVIGRLDNIFKVDVYRDILKNQATFLQKPTHKNDIYTAHDEKALQITHDLRPARVALNMVEVLSALESLLSDTLAGNLKNIQITDITEHLYDKAQDKKGSSKLKASITSSVKSLSIPINYDTGKLKGSVDTTITVGIDTPTRNTLAAIASQQPTVRVVSWKESPLAFRYATVVETKDDAGIWAGFYSNLRLLTTTGSCEET